MTRLRDIELRWSKDDPAPETFWRRLPTACVFFRRLRSLRIETQGIMKINVYCEPDPERYRGDLVDGVTAVDVACNWESIGKLPPADLNAACVGLLAEGVKTVFKRFAIPSRQIDQIADSLSLSEVMAPIAIGKRAARPRIGRLYARTSVEPSTDLTCCVVMVNLTKGRTTIARVPVCTTFPSVEWPIDDFESIQWRGHNIVVIKFRSKPADSRKPKRTVFGRAQFDCDGFDNVRRRDTPVGRTAGTWKYCTFEVNLTAVLAGVDLEQHKVQSRY